MNNKRFQDENFIASHFNNCVWTYCPSCNKKAFAKANHEEAKIRTYCESCGYNKIVSSEIKGGGQLIMAAHNYFNAELWLRAPFKNEVFIAYNDEYLIYLEKYIAAGLREHKDRTHFTLLEK